jgi:DNA-binding HxlR family transcriptional regulator/putative sterol carrier protein
MIFGMPTSSRTPKSYDQYCPVARSLDVLGERWTLLIVRDLISGPKRYTDLREGLPGIATDLLTARLRTLEAAGFVARRELPRPAPATVYELTDAGRELAPVILALAQIGFGMLGAPKPTDDVSAERVVMLGLRLGFRPSAVGDLTESYQLNIDGQPFSVAVANGTAKVASGVASNPAMTFTTDARTLVAVMRAETTLEQAQATGSAQLEGDRAAYARFAAAFVAPPAPVRASEMQRSADAAVLAGAA